MAQTVLITLTIAGTDTGPFDLYSDADGYTSPFAINISKAALTAGYTSYAVPNAATLIKIVSKGTCTNSITLPIVGTSATTSTTSSSSTSSTSSSSTSSTSSTSTTSRLACVQQVFFNVTQAGIVRYTACCGGTLVELGVEIGYQSIDTCLILNSLIAAPGESGAVISEITYSAASCTCP
jgi:hypothetical protein